MHIDVQFQFFIRTERTRAGVNPHSSSPSVLHISFQSYSFLFFELMHIYLDGIRGYLTFLTELIQVFDSHVIEYIDPRLNLFLSIFKTAYELQFHGLSFAHVNPLISHYALIPILYGFFREIAFTGFTSAFGTPYDISIVTIPVCPTVFVNHHRPSSAFTTWFQAYHPIYYLIYFFTHVFHFFTHSLKVNPVMKHSQSAHPTYGAKVVLSLKRLPPQKGQGLRSLVTAYPS